MSLSHFSLSANRNKSKNWSGRSSVSKRRTSGGRRRSRTWKRNSGPANGKRRRPISENALSHFPSRPLGVGLPLPFGERRRLPFAGPEFLFQVLDLLLQPLVLRLETLDLPLQFFDLFRLAARRKWLRLIHPKLRYTNAAGLSREKFRRHPVRPLINYIWCSSSQHRMPLPWSVSCNRRAKGLS